MSPACARLALISILRHTCPQAWGFLNLFGRFFPVAITFLRATPGVGNLLNLPVISTVVDKLAGVGGGGGNLPY